MQNLDPWNIGNLFGNSPTPSKISAKTFLFPGNAYLKGLKDDQSLCRLKPKIGAQNEKMSQPDQVTCLLTSTDCSVKRNRVQLNRFLRHNGKQI